MLGQGRLKENHLVVQRKPNACVVQDNKSDNGEEARAKRKKKEKWKERKEIFILKA